MPAAISTDEEIALTELAELLRNPERYGCRFECSAPEANEPGASKIVEEALAIIDCLKQRHYHFPEYF